eukprot:365452-Chlamydomonas_euryale.AAC.24
MRAQQRLNTAYFVVGYLGFLTTWIFDLIVLLLNPPHLAWLNNAAKVRACALGVESKVWRVGCGVKGVTTGIV